MRTLDATATAEKNKVTNQPIFLYTIHDYDGASNNLNYAEYDTDITFAGVTYTKFPITHDSIGENSQGSITSVKVRVANVNRVIEGYLQTYDLRGKKVTIRLVWANQLADTDSYIDDIFWIDSYTANEEVVEFTLTTRFNILEVELPCRKFSRTYCSWTFKGTECGYSGAQTTCDKLFATCRDTMANSARFGGFPSVPTGRLYA